MAEKVGQAPWRVENGWRVARGAGGRWWRRPGPDGAQDGEKGLRIGLDRVWKQELFFGGPEPTVSMMGRG